MRDVTRAPNYHARSFMISVYSFFHMLQTPFIKEKDFHHFHSPYGDLYEKIKNKKTFRPNGIDKVDLGLLHTVMSGLGNVPVPPKKRCSYNYTQLVNCRISGRLVLFFMMKVKVNVQIFTSENAYIDW